MKAVAALAVFLVLGQAQDDLVKVGTFKAKEGKVSIDVTATPKFLQLLKLEDGFAFKKFVDKNTLEEKYSMDLQGTPAVKNVKQFTYTLIDKDGKPISGKYQVDLDRVKLEIIYKEGTRGIIHTAFEKDKKAKIRIQLVGNPYDYKEVRFMLHHEGK